MSNAPIRIRRKNNFNLIKEGRKLQSFDDFPMLRPDVDPQMHVSRNRVDQPFYLSSDKDMVLAQFSGASRVLFIDGPVRYFDLDLGDFVYVPAGSAHRVLTREEGLMIRYKAAEPGREEVSWKCASCGETVARHAIAAGDGPVQQGYQAGCEAFNAGDRTCASCGKVHDLVDLTPFRWNQVTETLLLEEDEDEDGPAR